MGRRRKPCVKACPIQATWMEPDGIVVVDYDWCFGCRYCMTACPYSARFLNWGKPDIPPAEINPTTHDLGNRPPACHEASPTGARVFGNLLDHNGAIRYVLENKAVFRLREELGTEPKFWYFRDE